MRGFLTGIGLLLLSFSTHAVTLEWDANSETNIAGYRVYTGRQSRVYDSVLDVGNQTLAYLATTPGTTYFAVTAYNTDGLESDFSDEVSFSVPIPNSAPVTQPDQYIATRNVSLNASALAGVLANDSDADGDVLIVLLVSPVTHGTLMLNTNGSFIYVPAQDFTGADSFSYHVTDGQATSAVTSVSITVNFTPNSLPAVQSDQYAAAKNTPLSIAAPGGVLANDSDADGDMLAVLLASSVTHGTLTLNGDGSFIYVPAQNFTGPDSFSYRVTDGKGTSVVAAVTITVSGSANSPPTAQSDVYLAVENVPLDVSGVEGVLANDFDPEGDPLAILLVSSVTNGNLSLNTNGGFTYIPALDFTGDDSFSYCVTDGKATSAVVVARIFINPSANLLTCSNCFAALDAMLSAESNRFPSVWKARWSVSTNAACPQYGVLVFDALWRAAKGVHDAGLESAISSAVPCLVADLKSELSLRQGAASRLAPSRWTTAASNQITAAWRKLDRTLLLTNNLVRGQLLAAVISAIPRTERLIVAGDLAPTGLTNRVMTCGIKVSGTTELLKFVFGDGSFVLQTENGTPVTTGSYAYARTAWNKGSLVFISLNNFFDHYLGEVLTLELKFAPTRNRITGSLNGYFQFE